MSNNHAPIVCNSTTMLETGRARQDAVESPVTRKFEVGWRERTFVRGVRAFLAGVDRARTAVVERSLEAKKRMRMDWTQSLIKDGRRTLDDAIIRDLSKR